MKRGPRKNPGPTGFSTAYQPEAAIGVAVGAFEVKQTPNGLALTAANWPESVSLSWRMVLPALSMTMGPNFDYHMRMAIRVLCILKGEMRDKYDWFIWRTVTVWT